MDHISRHRVRCWWWVTGLAVALCATWAHAAKTPRPVDARILPAKQVQNHVRMTLWRIAWGGPKDSQRLRINYTLDDQRLVAALRGDWAIDRASVARWDGAPIEAAPMVTLDQLSLSNIDWQEGEIVLTVRACDRKAPKSALGLFDERLRFQDIPLPTDAEPVAVGATMKTAMGSTVTIREIGWWRPEDGEPQLALVCAADPPLARLDMDVRVMAARDAIVDDRGKHLEVDRLVPGNMVRKNEGKQAAAVATVLCRRSPSTRATSVTIVLTLRQHLADREKPEWFRAFSFRLAVPAPG